MFWGIRIVRLLKPWTVIGSFHVCSYCELLRLRHAVHNVSASEKNFSGAIGFVGSGDLGLTKVALGKVVTFT